MLFEGRTKYDQCLSDNESGYHGSVRNTDKMKLMVVRNYENKTLCE